jgi:hypothetical protein
VSIMPTMFAVAIQRVTTVRSCAKASRLEAENQCCDRRLGEVSDSVDAQTVSMVNRDSSPLSSSDASSLTVELDRSLLCRIMIHMYRGHSGRDTGIDF